MDELVRATAEEVFDAVKEDCTSSELSTWLEVIAGMAIQHLFELDGLPEDEVTDEDKAIASLAEPMLFLLGLTLKHEWIDRLENEQ
jgi:hypothetical protein